LAFSHSFATPNALLEKVIEVRTKKNNCKSFKTALRAYPVKAGLKIQVEIRISPMRLFSPHTMPTMYVAEGLREGMRRTNHGDVHARA